MILLLKSACLCAVNTYAMISGYVGVYSEPSLKKFLHLEYQAIFYSVIITVVCSTLDHQYSVYKIGLSFFPIISKSWWYYTAYAVMYFFLPLINRGIRQLEGDLLRKYAVGMTLFFAIGSTIGSFFIDNALFTGNGYSALWLLVMYICGAMLRITKNDGCKTAYTFMMFIACVLITTASQPILRSLYNKFGFSGEGNLLITYVSPFMVCAACCLLSVFSNIEIRNVRVTSVIKLLSPLTFGVYLIHTHNSIWELLKDRFDPVSDLPAVIVVGCVVLSSISIFGICSIIEWIRRKLFMKLGLC